MHLESSSESDGGFMRKWDLICWPRIFGLENLLPELCRVSSLAGPWIVLLKRHPPLGVSVKIKAHIAATASRVRCQDGVHKYHIQ